MNEWHRILRKVLNTGQLRPDRTGTGTLSVFGEQLCFDNRPGTFPAVTTKRLAFAQVVAELACFLRGHENLADFHALDCRIWDVNGNAGYWAPRRPGDLGRIYGVQWRRWRSWAPDFLVGGAESSEGHAVQVDQLRALVDGMRRDPFGRRHMVTAWNPGELDQMCLPPCHVLFQAYVYDGDPGKGDWAVDLRVDMRSVDLFLGLPFDIASYAVLQRLLAKELGYRSGFLTFQLGDAHIYANHLDQARTVLAREELPPPDLRLHPDASLFELDPAHVTLVGYRSHPAVPAPLNV